MEEKKKIVITGRTVLIFSAVLAPVVVLAAFIVQVVRGTPIVDVFTENPVFWLSAFAPGLILLAILGSEKKSETDEKGEQKED